MDRTTGNRHLLPIGNNGISWTRIMEITSEMDQTDVSLFFRHFDFMQRNDAYDNCFAVALIEEEKFLLRDKEGVDMKKLGVELIIMFAVFGIVFVSSGCGEKKEGQGMMHGQHHMMTGADTAKEATGAQSGENIVDVGNKTCPVTGDSVSGNDFVVYKGKRYGLCCASCKSDFMKDPEKYIEILKKKGEIK